MLLNIHDRWPQARFLLDGRNIRTEALDYMLSVGFLGSSCRYIRTYLCNQLYALRMNWYEDDGPRHTLLLSMLSKAITSCKGLRILHLEAGQATWGLSPSSSFLNRDEGGQRFPPLKELTIEGSLIPGALVDATIWDFGSLERLELLGHMHPFVKAITDTISNLTTLRIIETSELGSAPVDLEVNETYANFLSTSYGMLSIELSIHKNNTGIIPACRKHQGTLQYFKFWRYSRWHGTDGIMEMHPLSIYELDVLSTFPNLESLSLDLQTQPTTGSGEDCEDIVFHGTIFLVVSRLIKLLGI